MARYSVHKGPRGGVEFRQWTGESTFRTVSRYVAWPHLSESDREAADNMAVANREAVASRKANASAWRHIMRGGR